MTEREFVDMIKNINRNLSLLCWSLFAASLVLLVLLLGYLSLKGR